MRSGGAGKVEDGMHMNRKGIHPVFVPHLMKPAGDSPAGCVHKNVDASKTVDDPIDAASARCRIAHVDAEKLDRCTVLCGNIEKIRLGFRSASSRGGDYVSPAGSQLQSGGGADSTGAAGYETNPIL
jgi:hypothetical protein